MTTIIPVIIPKSFEELEEKVSLIVGHVDTVTIDISDGNFSPVTTWPLTGTGDSYAFKHMLTGEQMLPHAEKIAYELDMLVENPGQYTEDWIKVGVTSFVLHYGSDTEENLHACAESLKQKGKQVGIALKPGEDIELLNPFMSLVDFVQLMGNDKIGYNGVELDERVYEKIKDVHEMYPHVTISIDIGVNRETAPRLLEAGATKLISGSGIFKAQDPLEEIEFYKKL